MLMPSLASPIDSIKTRVSTAYQKFNTLTKNVQNIRKVKNLQKQVIQLKDNTSSTRPMAEPYWFAIQQDGILIPYYPQDDFSLFEVAKYSDVISTIIKTLRGEIFRNGWEFEKKFDFKCKECGQEYDYEPEHKKCENCGNDNLVEPDFDQIRELQNDFKSSVNLNNQTLIDVMKEYEDDTNIKDDSYLLFIKEYFFNEQGMLFKAKVNEIVRANPIFIKFVANEDGMLGIDENGEEIMTCVDHREEKWTNLDRCPRCGKELFHVHFAEYYGDKRKYYIKGEIIHTSRHNPSLTYGLSPIYPIWQKASMLWNLDRYNKQAYQRGRPPKGAFLVNTRNFESLRKSWEWLLEKTKQNPHMIWPFGVESNSNRGQTGQFIKFMDTMAEMQATEFMKEMRRSIGAVYGVEPIFQADVSASGGLNNEGLQITVTNRTIESAQGVYNNKVFPFILEQFGVTDWELKLLPSEEQDELADEQLQMLKTQRAQAMLNMNFDVELDEYGDFIFSGEAEKREEPNPLMPFGGMPGQQPFTGMPEPSIGKADIIRRFNKNVYQVAVPETIVNKGSAQFIRNPKIIKKFNEEVYQIA